MLAGVLFAVGVVAFLAGAVIDPEFLFTPWLLPTEAAFVMGGVVLWRRPREPMGWVFLLWGLAIHLSVVPLAIGLRTGPEDAAWWNAIGWGANTAATATFVPLSLLLFPDGRLPSRRWRAVGVLIGLGAVLGGAAAVLVGDWGGAPLPGRVNSPFGPGPIQVGLALSDAFFPVLVLGWVGSAAALVQRGRRARGEERQQLKVLGAAVGFAVVTGGIGILTSGQATEGFLAELLLAVAFSAVPLGAAIAVLRHRLWDIDVVLRRSIVVGLLAVFVTAVYAVVVVAVGRLLPIDDLVLSVAATALVAMLFAPLRSVASRAANRLLYGQRATPFEVLTDLAERIGAALPSDQLLEAMVARLADGTGAARTAVWLRVGDHLEPAAGWPAIPDHPPVPLPAGDDLPGIPGAEELAPVRRAGHLLGVLTATSARGEGFVPAERALLADLAGSAGLAIAKVALDRELTARVEELSASRRRVVAAEERARKRLERDLHDGAQQQLVALRVQLGLARTVASREHAEHLIPQLEALAATAEEAVDAVRGVAHGIYPPLLAAEGLPAALAAAARRAPLPVDLDVDADLGRHPQPVESACYFAALAALDAAAEAGATGARLGARADEGVLSLTVTADTAFDPAAFTVLGDRLDTLGGGVLVTNGDEGGRLDATLPLDKQAGAALAVAGSMR